jgi:hypothetical protein
MAKAMLSPPGPSMAKISDQCRLMALGSRVGRISQIRSTTCISKTQIPTAARALGLRLMSRDRRMAKGMTKCPMMRATLQTAQGPFMRTM